MVGLEHDLPGIAAVANQHQPLSIDDREAAGCCALMRTPPIPPT
jgi:hypothetical protein